MALTPELHWSVPSVIDGLNQGQRKILFATFKKNLVKEAKVSWLAGYAVKQASYNHGEQSAEDTIINMAQDFVGSNNLNLLEPHGQFGTSDGGGLDYAEGCNLYTCLSPLTRLLFPEEDDILLNHLEDAGRSVEPIWYIPIIPMVLVNGSRGCNSSALSYNPRDIIANLRQLLNCERMEPMDPWYGGFKGRVEKTGTTVEGSTYSTAGVIEVLDESALQITEIPIRCWTLDYKEFLESFVCCNARDNLHIEAVRLTRLDETSIQFKLMLDEKNMEIVMQEGLEKKLNLITTVGTTSMHLFDRTGKNIRRYRTPEEILEEFFGLRLEYYEKRKKVQLESLNLDFLKMSNKVRFILNVGHGDLTVIDREVDDLVHELQRKEFSPFPKSGEKPGGGKSISASDYEYLLSIPISSTSR